MPIGGPCWFTSESVKVGGFIHSGHGPVTSSICYGCNGGIRYNYTCHGCTDFSTGCYIPNQCGTPDHPTGACPPPSTTTTNSCAAYSKHNKKNKLNSLNKELTDTLNNPNILTTVEWYPFVISNYYKITVFQNNKRKQYIIESSNLCKQVVDIDVLPDIPAFIQIYGFTENPSTSKCKVNDVYTVKYTFKIDDENTCSYENLSTVRRSDKETEGSVVYETVLIEGVSSTS